MSFKDIHDQRHNYELYELTEDKVSPEPFSQFSRWFDDATATQMLEPNAMVLSTATKNGKPSSRVVLLKAFSSEGFIFYTNYNSKKGKELDNNNQASLLFFWDKLHRQVRIEGTIEKVEAQFSDKYFSSRPFESQLSAVVSNQSEEVPSRKFLEDKLEELKKGQGVKRPEYWGGYRLKTDYFEFWQGRPNRLHDRLVYTLQNGSWQLKRLAP